jgi:glycosyltransferase involved in cell wall biosynthesis
VAKAVGGLLVAAWALTVLRRRVLCPLVAIGWPLVGAVAFVAWTSLADGWAREQAPALAEITTLVVLVLSALVVTLPPSAFAALLRRTLPSKSFVARKDVRGSDWHEGDARFSSGGSMNHRPRVLLLVDTVGGGGAERVVADLATHLDAQRFEVTVCATRAASFLAPEVRAAGIPVVVIGRRHRWDIRGLLRLWRYLRRGRFDLLHSHKFGSNLWARLFGRASGIPVVIIQEHGRNYQGGVASFLRSLVDRALSPLCDLIITPSDADRLGWERVVGVPGRKLVTIRNGVATPPPRAESLRREFGIDGGTVVIGSVGRLEAEKGYDRLLHAFARVVEHRPDVRLIIIGDGTDRDRLAMISEELGISSQIILAGWREQANSIMQEFDIVANASSREGLPLVLIEAMSVGRPIVATAVGGVPEVVVDGMTGFLVPPGDSDQLADRLLRLIADASLREQLGRRGLERYRAMFTVDRMARDVERVYLACLERVGAAGTR